MNALLRKLKRGGHEGSGAKFALPRSSVLLPLYIYPLDDDSWKPLHKAITDHPHLNFVVIVNPHNGPGANALPDDNYSREIPKLNAHANVQLIGYVRTDYCRRDLGSVCEDIAKYAGWSQATIASSPAITKSGGDDHGDGDGKGAQSSQVGARRNMNLGVQGIFFDETPNLYAANVAVYLNSITRYVKNLQGILGARLVIHNPGTVPDPNLTSTAGPNPDITAILESSHEIYQTPSTHERITNLLTYRRDRCCYIIHSVPANEIESLVLELRCKAGYIFVTIARDNEGCYTRFASSWEGFVRAMAKKST